MIGVVESGGSVLEGLLQPLNEAQASSTAAAAAMLARPAVTSDLKAWNVLAITICVRGRNEHPLRRLVPELAGPGRTFDTSMKRTARLTES